MNEQLKTLDALLDAIRTGILEKRNPAREAWYKNAVGTVIGNVDMYRKGIAEAAATDSSEDDTKAACRVSGIRKGIGDLGILDPEKDRDLIATIDEADMLATQICAST